MNEAKALNAVDQVRALLEGRGNTLIHDSMKESAERMKVLLGELTPKVGMKAASLLGGIVRMTNNWMVLSTTAVMTPDAHKAHKDGVILMDNDMSGLVPLMLSGIAHVTIEDEELARWAHKKAFDAVLADRRQFSDAVVGTVGDLRKHSAEIADILMKLDDDPAFQAEVAEIMAKFAGGVK